MLVVFQFAIIFLVGLIAYWWANQGFFSSLLHFVAVVCAGAIALAFWEPLVMGVLLKNWASDNYAWGVSLCVLFLVSLVVIRVAFDRLAPANVQIPHTANLLLGGVFGVGSGILTVGILMIGGGMVQGADELVGFKGLGREGRDISTNHGGNSHKLWVPAHTWTADFFEFISAGAFFPEIGRKPLGQLYPDLDQVAWGLHRDTYHQGMARTTTPPEAITIPSDGVSMTDTTVFVDVVANNKAYDHAVMFVLSRSQVRLLGYQGNDVTRGEVSVAFPERWTQQVATGTAANLERTFLFDNPSHYVTSMPGMQDVRFQLEFPIGAGEHQLRPGAIPRYIQIKGVRYELPRVLQGSAQQVRGAPDSDNPPPPDDPNAPMATEDDIVVRHDLRPIVSATINNLLSIKHVDKQLTEGQQTWRVGERGGTRETRIDRIFATEGTKIVRVDVSRSRNGNLHGPARERAEQHARATPGAEDGPRLYDAAGNAYRPKGYIHSTPDEATIKLTPSDLIRSVADLPYLPTDGTHHLWLIYEIPVGTTITSFRYGEQTAMRANVTVTF
jgi:hypothetical protein